MGIAAEEGVAGSSMAACCGGGITRMITRRVVRARPSPRLQQPSPKSVAATMPALHGMPSQRNAPVAQPDRVMASEAATHGPPGQEKVAHGLELAIQPGGLKRLKNAPVAQPDRVVASEAIGRGFESLQAHHPPCDTSVPWEAPQLVRGLSLSDG